MDFVGWWESLHPWWNDAGWPWISDWMQSAGFAGTAAVAAAVIAFFSARSQKRRESWWETIRWSVDLALEDQDPDSRQGVVGLRVVQALAKSKHVKDDQYNVVRAVTGVFLDPKADGDETDDFPDELAGDGAGEDVDDSQSESTYLIQEEAQHDHGSHAQADSDESPSAVRGGAASSGRNSRLRRRPPEDVDSGLDRSTGP